ncbi:hypothetical protein RvY_01691-3 [Ramazzottius varieornatus]|uniref:REJ domain-containing protein n=1 Tax=Ramazzottius varieornatus TaxID=947166 RepID=A0A1D1UP91_RAMVA|nr:hypothetical protein RvY_01691-3 [Ramazzottius varieornatus]
MYKLTVDHPIPELTEDWTGPRKSNEVTHDDAIKDIKKNDKFMAFPANTFMYGLYMDMLKVTATSNETIQSFTDAAENFTDISPFITTIVTNIQDLMANLTLAMADVEKEAESPNPTEDLVFASQMLNDSLKSMNESVANLTDIQALLPNASAALTEAANAKVDSVKPNRIVTTKAPLPPDPNSTIPIVPPKSTAEIATDALKLVERMAVVVNTTIKAIDNASMAIATVMTLMGAVPPSIKTAELNVSRAMHQFDRHLWNMTDKLDTVRRGKTAIDSDLINVDRGWFNITATPIKLEIKGGTKRIVSKTDSIVLDASNPQFSWDPDDSTPAENQTLTYYWFGTPVDGAFPERYFPQPPISVETLVSSSCQYPSCSGFIPDSKGQKTYTIPGPLKEGVYFFSVTVEVQRNMEGRTPTVLTPCIGTATQMVTVVADGFPSVEINCLKSNCAARIDAGERFALEGTCEHCDGATFLWEVLSTSDEDFDQFIWTNDSTNHSRVEFNKTWPIFAVLPNNFPLEAPEALYRFKFTVTMPDNKTSTTAEYSARINEPPSGGICIVDPTEGYELETLFDVECRGFIDKDHDLPLMYRFHYHNGEEKVVAPNDTAEMEG